MADASIKRIGDYELLDPLGEGGQGRVFKAVYAAPDNPKGVQGEVVAIKILHRQGTDDAAIDQLRQQSQVFKTFTHRNIVRYRDFFVSNEGEWDETICIVMDLLEGGDLKTLLKDRPAGLPWAQVRSIFEQCLDGLIDARSKGVCHRDLKPSNIAILRDGNVKLIDFGIAHIGDSESTPAGEFKGTFDYMAPDFVLVSHLKDYEPCDVFSLGVCFYQALTGEFPFPPCAGDSHIKGHIAYVNRWQDAKGPDISFKSKVFKVYPGARAFIRKCLAVRPEDRYQTFVDMRAALLAISPYKVRHKDGDTYEFEEWIARGGFGEVYRAHRVQDGRTVAVKYLASTQNSPHRFITEARLIKGFPHPHIVEYVDFLQTERPDGSKDYFLILEYLEGMPGFSLRGRLKNNGQGLPVEEVLTLFEGYLDALQYLHAGNGQEVIIHRDIKPSNLYAPVGAPAKAKVFDLGVARDVKGTATAGMIPGTLDYMPPEFAEGDDRGTPKSDIYSLGLCLYEALTGKPVFPPLPRAEREAWPKFTERSSKNPKLDFNAQVFRDCSRLESILQNALAQKPRHRFASAEAMRLEIQKALTHHRRAIELEMEQEPDIEASDPETRPGEEGQLTTGMAPTKAPQTGAQPPDPVTTGEELGQTHGAGTLTVGQTAGTGSVGGLKEQVEEYRAQKALKRRLVLVAAALLLGIALVGGAVALFLGYREKTLLNAVDSLLRNESLPTTAHVNELASYKEDLYRLSLKRPDDSELKRSRQSLESRIQALPMVFSNSFVHALAVGDGRSASDLLAQWDAASSTVVTLDLKGAELAGLRSWMSQGVAKMNFDNTVKELGARIPRQLTLANLNTAEVLLNDIEKVTQAEGTYLAPAKKTILQGMVTALVTNMTSLIESRLLPDAERSNAGYQELRRLPERAPRLVACARNVYDQAMSRVEEMRRHQTLRDQVEKLTAFTAGVLSDKEFSTLLDRYATLLGEPELTRADRQNLGEAVLRCCQRLAGGTADLAMAAYARLNVQEGGEQLNTLESLVARSERWFKDDPEIREIKKKAIAARDQALKELELRRQAKRTAAAEATDSLRDLNKRSESGFATPEEAVLVARGLFTVRAGLAQDIASEPGVAQACSAAVSACRKALAGYLVRRDDLPGRSARIDAMAGLLNDKPMREMLDDEQKSLAVKLEREHALFVFKVINSSGQGLVMRLGPDGEKTSVPVSQKIMELELPAPRVEVRQKVVIDAVEKGYVAQTAELVLVGGAGAELLVKPFQITSVDVRLRMAPIEAGESTARCTYRETGRTQWSDWPAGTVLLQPGGYDLQFTRDDHEQIVHPLRVQMAAGICEVEGPPANAWKPLPALASLMEMRRLWQANDLKSLAIQLVGMEPTFQWKGYVEEYRKLKADCFGKITREVTEKLPQADAEVLAYCSALYQVADPPLNKRRRLKEGLHNPKMNPVLPVYPLTAIGDEKLQGQYRRLQAWQDAASGLADDATRERLIAVLKRLGSELTRSAPMVADRCRFESALLGWDYSGAVPSGLDTLQSELARWQAHAGFRPFEPVPEVLELLTSYQQRAGSLDAYDLRLGCYEAAYCWNNYIQSVLQKKTEGYVIDGKGSVYNPEEAYRQALRSHRTATLRILARLKDLTGGNGAAAIPDVARYLNEQQDPQAALMIRFFQGNPKLVGKGVTDEFRKIKLADEKKQAPEYAVLTDLLTEEAR
jgi:serine/threonine protein kinase